MISVCMATYNGALYLEEQLTSVIKQLEPSDELLISDDGSSDKTLEILQMYQHDQVKLYFNNFRNPALNFEFLLHKVSKQIVVLCDQDDIWMDDKLEVIRQKLKGKKTYCLQMNAKIIDEKGNYSGHTTFDRWRSRPGFLRNLIRNTYMGSSMAFTSDLLEMALPFPDKVPMHDWWIGLLAEKTATVEFMDEPYMYYRIHSHNASLMGSSLSKKIMWRIKMIRAVQQRLKKRKWK